MASEEPTANAGAAKQSQQSTKSVPKAQTQQPAAKSKAAHKSKAAPATSKSSTSSKQTATTSSKSPTVASGSPTVASSSSAVPAKQSAASPSTTAPDPIAEAPEAVWYVRPPTGGQYGPADGEIMLRWLDEGRVSGDSLVWREGWDDWKAADAVFPVLQKATTQTADEPVATEILNDVPQEQFAFDESRSRSRHANARLPSNKSSIRNVAIVVVLSVACIGLLVALLFVLQSRG